MINTLSAVVHEELEDSSYKIFLNVRSSLLIYFRNAIVSENGLLLTHLIIFVIILANKYDFFFYIVGSQCFQT